MIKGVIFDLDGLLIDSEPFWKKADIKLAKKYNFSIDDKFRKKLTGRGVKECSEILMQSFNLKETVEDLTNERLKYVYQFLFKDLKLMPFARELIKKLKKHKFILALATAGHEKTTAIKLMQKLSIFKNFSFVMSGLELANSKPAPDIYLLTAEKLKLSATECIVIEDSVNGAIAGKSADMKVVGINRDKEVRQSLKKAKADYIFTNLNIPLKIFG